MRSVAPNVFPIGNEEPRIDDPRVAQLDAEIAEEKFICIPGRKAAESERILYLPLRKGDRAGEAIQGLIREFRENKKFRAFAILPPEEMPTIRRLQAQAHHLASQVYAGCLDMEFHQSAVQSLREHSKMKVSDEMTKSQKFKMEIGIILQTLEKVAGSIEEWPRRKRMPRLRKMGYGLLQEPSLLFPRLKNDALQMVMMSPLYEEPENSDYSTFYREIGFPQVPHPRFASGSALVGVWVSDIMKRKKTTDGRMTYFRRMACPYLYDVNGLCPPMKRISPSMEAIDLDCRIELEFGIPCHEDVARKVRSKEELFETYREIIRKIRQKVDEVSA